MLYQSKRQTWDCQQFTGKPMQGVIHQKAQLVEAPERGISFNRPERWVVNTFRAQVEIGVGDWLVRGKMGEYYVFDYSSFNQYFEMCDEQGAAGTSNRPHARNPLAALARMLKKAFIRDAEQSQ